MKKYFIIILCYVFLFSACTVQDAHLVSLPDPTYNPTAEPTLTPPPETLTIPDVTGQPFSTDLNGIVITDPSTHYYEYYITLSDIRIYEYETGTFLDGKLTNSYPQTLSGKLRIIFKNKDGITYGYGDIYTSGGTLNALPGENLIYSDILTEVDVQMMDFTIQVIGSFIPVD